MTPYKPERYTSLSPYLMVDDAQQLVDLLSSLFGATTLRRFDREDGMIAHIELLLDDSVLMISESPPDYPAGKAMLHFYVPQVRETYRKAMELGCTGIEEPQNRPGDPDTRGAFYDSAGNYWAVSTQASGL